MCGRGTGLHFLPAGDGVFDAVLASDMDMAIPRPETRSFGTWTQRERSLIHHYQKGGTPLWVDTGFILC